MTSIHGSSHKALKHFRKHPSALAIYWIYVSRTNNENVAYPTITGLAKDTGWNKSTINKDRNWLVEVKALEPVTDYVRKEWRELPPKQRAQKRNFDKSEYYRPTGYIEVNGEKLTLLYFGAQEKSDIEQSTDVLPQPTSVHNRHQSTTDVSPRVPELNTNKDIELDSKKDVDSEKESLSSTPNVQPNLPSEMPQPDITPLPEKAGDTPPLMMFGSINGVKEPPPPEIAPQPPAPSYAEFKQVAARAFHLTNAAHGLQSKYTNFLIGKVEEYTPGRGKQKPTYNGAFFEYQIDPAMSYPEIIAFEFWLSTHYDGQPLRKPETINDYVGRFRSDPYHDSLVRQAVMKLEMDAMPKPPPPDPSTVRDRSEEGKKIMAQIVESFS